MRLNQRETASLSLSEDLRREQTYLDKVSQDFSMTTFLKTLMKRNQQRLMKTKHVKQLLMNYQTVVDEVTSPMSPLASPCHVSVSLLSVKRRRIERKEKRRRRGEERGQKTELEERGRARVRGQNIEEAMEKRRGKSCRGQMTGEEEEVEESGGL